MTANRSSRVSDDTRTRIAYGHASRAWGELSDAVMILHGKNPELSAQAEAVALAAYDLLRALRGADPLIGRAPTPKEN